MWGSLVCVSSERRAVLLIDGVCNLCEGCVRFIVPRDPEGRFAFAALQSETGERLLREAGLPNDLDTVVLLEDGRSYARSTAILRVLRRLSGAWPLLYALIAIPRPLRDWAYAAFIAHRYRWFGKKDACLVPGPDLAARFLD